MKSVQFSLPISQPARRLAPEERTRARKHGLIAGRPRRLAIDSTVVKIAIPPELVPAVDRIRQYMSATRPECIRTAVSDLLVEYGDAALVPPPDKEVKRTSPQGRCKYWKVPFSPRMLEGIDALAEALGWNRQRVISLAIREMIASYV